MELCSRIDVSGHEARLVPQRKTHCYKLLFREIRNLLLRQLRGTKTKLIL